MQLMGILDSSSNLHTRFTRFTTKNLMLSRFGLIVGLTSFIILTLIILFTNSNNNNNINISNNSVLYYPSISVVSWSFSSAVNSNFSQHGNFSKEGENNTHVVNNNLEFGVKNVSFNGEELLRENVTVLGDFGQSYGQSYGGGNFSKEGKKAHVVNLGFEVKNVSFFGQESRGNSTQKGNFSSDDVGQSYGGGNFSKEGKKTHVVNLGFEVKNVSFYGNFTGDVGQSFGQTYGVGNFSSEGENSHVVNLGFEVKNVSLDGQSNGGGNFSKEGKNVHLVNLGFEVKDVSFHGKESRDVNVSVGLDLNGFLKVNNDNNGGVGGGLKLRGCDIFDGKWVKDDSLPHYQPGSCTLIDPDFNCHLNGRPDQGFYKWRWQPSLCNIPRLNATDFLERMRGRKLVFVGDSLNRNMWESLVCLLRVSVKNKSRVHEISGRWEFKKQGFYAFRFEDYNCTIDYVRAPFLVRESTFQGQNGSFPTLRLDLMDETTKMYHDADILIFNTGHWWTHEKTSRGEDYYQEGKHLYPRLKALQAYGKALRTWGRWVDRHVNPNKTLVFFRGYSGTHFRGGQWNSGGQCHKETEPISNETYLGQYPSKMRVLEQVLGKMKTHVMYLNISRLTDYRKDAHPSVYRKSYETPKEVTEAEHSQDCSHWCLPGVPDIWNELLYASLLKVGWKPPISQL